LAARREGEAVWTVSGKVRAREAEGVVTVAVDGITTQAKYYKPLLYEFFRKEWRGARPAWGDRTVEIMVEHIGEPPWMDLDNLAKAILDGIKGWLFHDDSQVARLLVERRPGTRERITVTIAPARPRAVSKASPAKRGRSP
jgi:hypothetical protein